MTNEVFSLLLDQRISELNGKAVESGLSKMERAELRALEAHQDKAPAVAHRIRILAGKMAQPNRLHLLWLRFSKKFKQNLAELEALIHYGHSQVVWEIAYLNRKKAVERLNAKEESELRCFILFHDSPDVRQITQLKLKNEFEGLSAEEQRELTTLQRNLYTKDGVPNHLMDLLWPSKPTLQLDWSNLQQARK